MQSKLFYGLKVKRSQSADVLLKGSRLVPSLNGVVVSEFDLEKSQQIATQQTFIEGLTSKHLQLERRGSVNLPRCRSN